MKLWVIFTLLLCNAMDYSVSAQEDSCVEPTLDAPLSLCGFCSDESAAVEWMAYPTDVVHKVAVEYSCTTPDGQVITDAMDTCFNARYLPRVPAFSQGTDANGIVHGQHSTGLHFAPGTVCTFTATSEDLSLFYAGPTRVVSCTIKSSEECTEDAASCRLPVECGANSDVCQCSCSHGYGGYISTNANPHFCQDIDECALGTDNCDATATCTDTEGSFNCTCNPGFEGDGVNCMNAATIEHLTSTFGSSTLTAPTEQLQGLMPSATPKPKTERASASVTLPTEQSQGLMPSATPKPKTGATTTAPSTTTTAQTPPIASAGLSTGAMATVFLVALALFTTLLISTAAVACGTLRKRRSRNLKARRFEFISSEKFDPNFEPSGLFQLPSCNAESLHSIFNSLQYDGDSTKQSHISSTSPSKLLPMSFLDTDAYSERSNTEEMSPVSEHVAHRDCKSIASSESDIHVSVNFERNLPNLEDFMPEMDASSNDFDPIPLEINTDAIIPNEESIDNHCIPGYITESQAAFVTPSRRTDTIQQLSTAIAPHSAIANGYLTESSIPGLTAAPRPSNLPVPLTLPPVDKQLERHYTESGCVTNAVPTSVQADKSEKTDYGGTIDESSQLYHFESCSTRAPTFCRFNSTSSGYYTQSEEGFASTPNSYSNHYTSVNEVVATDFKHIDQSVSHNNTLTVFFPPDQAETSLLGYIREKDVFNRHFGRENLKIASSVSTLPYLHDGCSIDSGAVCFDFPAY